VADGAFATRSSVCISSRVTCGKSRATRRSSWLEVDTSERCVCIACRSCEIASKRSGGSCVSSRSTANASAITSLVSFSGACSESSEGSSIATKASSFRPFRVAGHVGDENFDRNCEISGNPGTLAVRGGGLLSFVTDRQIPFRATALPPKPATLPQKRSRRHARRRVRLHVEGRRNRFPVVVAHQCNFPVVAFASAFWCFHFHPSPF